MNVQDRRFRDLHRESVEWTEPPSMQDAQRQLEDLHDAIAAGQSLDDLGSLEANDAAWNRIVALLDRYKRLEAWIVASGGSPS